MNSPSISGVRGLLNSGTDYLTRAGVDSSALETEILLSHILDCPRLELYLDEFSLQENELRQFWKLLAVRAEGVPLQYILGSTEFMGLKFKVGSGVFIPRPETEILVETVINILSDQSAHGLAGQQTILDIGTGCGSIAVSLARYLPKVCVFACDICDFALQLTKENSYLNKVEIGLVKSDLFGAFKKGKRFSLILSNPPYISTTQIPMLARELHHEPKAALDGGTDGLYYCRRIIKEAADYLQDKGILVLEIGDNQASAVKRLFRQSRSFSPALAAKDYNGTERVIVAQKIGHQ